MLLNAKLWHDLLYEQCVFRVTRVCSSVYASIVKVLELLYGNLHIYICIYTNCLKCFMSMLKCTKHPAQCDFSMKSKGIWYAAAQLELGQPFWELPAQEVFMQRLASFVP